MIHDCPDSLSLCMIVKNEQAHLARCLASVRPAVDELIVVDTGSTDRTRAIAAAHGARVFDFVWGDDYADARNFSLTKAVGEWIFVLDGDEVLSSRDRARLRKIANQAYHRQSAYSFVTRNYTFDAHQVGWIANKGAYLLEEAGSGWIPTAKVRLFPNDPNIRFSYPVHEVVEPALLRMGIPIRSCSVPIHHYGPLNAQKINAKNRHYYRIGLTKLAAGRHNPAALHELAVQAGNLGRFDEAIQLWRQSISLQPGRADAYVHLSTAYFQQAEYELGKRAARAALNLAPEMKEALYNRALCEIFVGDMSFAAKLLEELLQIHPAFQPAQCLLAMLRCCASENDAGVQTLTEFLQTALGAGLTATLLDLVQRLTGVGRVRAACRVRQAAVRAGIGNAT